MIEEGKTLLSFMEVFIVGGKYTTQKYKIKKGMKKMKKMKKISKIFLVLTMIFSQLSSVVTVLADEVVSKPLETSLSVATDEELGYIKEYNLTYERVRQIESNAINKIRNGKKIDDFLIYMSNPKEAKKRLYDFRENYKKDKKLRYKKSI